ncbi:MAG: hypothetical protein QOF36_590, partial [Microbacteriaceae bacterium]|nr:hypothetical protein [Microbacteriaceae bacterium]
LAHVGGDGIREVMSQLEVELGRVDAALDRVLDPIS